MQKSRYETFWILHTEHIMCCQARLNSTSKAVNLPLFSSFGPNIRSRRSTSSQSGCLLITCIYHDLFYRLSLTKKNAQTDTTAPKSKMGPGGFGRRRRSLLDATQLILETGTHRWSTETGQRVSNPKSTHMVA